MRESGVLMPVSSLPGEYSIGSFGDEAKKFVDFLADCGFSYWQVLPFCMVDECNSPYKSYSAFGGNPYFVDLPTLFKKGLLTAEELSACRQMTPYACEYVRLYHTRFEVLAKAAARADLNAVKCFIESDPYIEKFCRFMALKKANGEKPWNEWTVTEPDEPTLRLWQFIQYEFFSQWDEIHRYAQKRGVKIIGDIPIYVAYDSCDVWSNREQFQLDEDGFPSAVAGVPPDYFCEDGQLWGNPLYDWEKMKADGYRWWRDRLRHMFSMFDGVRIDHFRGLESYYAVPRGERTARTGTWRKGPGEAFIDVIRAEAAGRLVIAEDLGEITDEVRSLVSYSGFPGMRVLQFGFFGDRDNPHKIHNYPENCVAYTGTHDNNTLLGYVWELSEKTRRTLLSYCGYDAPDWDHGYDSIIRTMLQSHAGLVILPIQDILGFGSDTRFNIPGKADGNWQFRVTGEQLATVDKEKYKRFLTLYERC